MKADGRVLGLPLTNSHNARSAKLTFHIPHAGVLHGFGGYFEAVLYGNVGISIHPERMALISKDMLSWFPLFFPLKVRLLFHLSPVGGTKVDAAHRRIRFTSLPTPSSQCRSGDLRTRARYGTSGMRKHFCLCQALPCRLPSGRTRYRR